MWVVSSWSQRHVLVTCPPGFSLTGQQRGCSLLLDLKPKNASSSHNRNWTPSWVWAARRLPYRLWKWRTTPTGIFVQQATRWRLEIRSELSIGAAVLTLTNSDAVLPSSSHFASTLLCRHRLTFILILFYLPVKLHCGPRIKPQTSFVFQDGHCVCFPRAHCDCLLWPN